MPRVVLLLLCVIAAGCDYGKPSGGAEEGADPPAVEAPDGREPPPPAQDLSGFQSLVVADAHNDSVTAEERARPQPVRGGTLRVRQPTLPPGLNRHLGIMNVGDQNELNGQYLFAAMIERDRETLERYPWVAKYWETQDVLDLLPPGVSTEESEKTPYERLYGRVVRVVEGEQVEFLEGAKQVVVNRFEARREGRAVVLDTGERFEASRIETPGRWTYRIECVSGRRRVVPWSRLAKRSWFVGEGSGRRGMVGVRHGCRHTIHIRDGVRWHDGRPFTAADVLFTVKDVILNEHVAAAQLRSSYTDLDEIIAPDALTVRFTWRKPFFESLALSGDPEVVPRHLYWKPEYEGDPRQFGADYNSHAANEAPVGNGPYRFVRWDKGAKIVIERNNDFFACKVGFPFWSADQPYLDRIELHQIKNALAATRGMARGEIDVDKKVEPSVWRSEAANAAEFVARFVRLKSPKPSYTYIGWNMRKPMFADARVRRALTMLIPRKAIADQIHEGLATVVSGPFYSASPAYDRTIELIPYDVEAARALLKSAGFVDRDGDGWLDWKDPEGVVRTFSFEYLLHNAREYHERIAVKVQESLKKAGVKVTLRKIDWAIFSKTIRQRRFDAARYARGVSVDPDVYSGWHSSMAEEGQNYIGYVNPEVDRLLELARTTLDGPRRWAHLRQIHRILHRDQPNTFMFSFYTLAFVNKQFRGVKFYPTSNYGPDYTGWWLPLRFQKLRPGSGK